jgi:hypothetical protein
MRLSGKLNSLYLIWPRFDRYLNLAYNMFEYIPLPQTGFEQSNFAKLQILQLDGVNISSNGSEWGTAISQVGPTLQNLSMAHCSLTSPLDPSLIHLSQSILHDPIFALYI